jgi:WD40 repeat protein
MSFLASHQATRASERLRPHDETRSPIDSLRVVTNLSRLLEVSEAFEHVASDAMAGWIPLNQLGWSASAGVGSRTADAVEAFVDLWCALGSLPEFAPTLSEAATVAAAEVASAAALQASTEQQKKKVPASRRLGGLAQSRAKSSSLGSIAHNAIFDTTSADSLHGAYPVRFSAAATGPWSGRGLFASLYCEPQALFRTLCVSSSDPPAVIVATPRGIQEIVPSSYRAMPAGFRAHYFSKRKRRDGEGVGSSGSRDARRAASQGNGRAASGSGAEEVFESGFGEGRYVALDLQSGATQAASSARRSSRYTARRREPVWRHQVESTALAAHPLRRRFVSGDTHGILRLWDFEDPIALAELRNAHIGRVSSIRYSAYGNAIAASHTSGHVTLWKEPDHACMASGHAHPSNGGARKDCLLITAFQGHASDVVFLDERFVVATVGEQSSPPCAGHSLRVFDTREAHATYEPSWSARVHSGGEARCLALLEDRIRVVTGGLDGTLCVVDLRMSRKLSSSSSSSTSSSSSCAASPYSAASSSALGTHAAGTGGSGSAGTVGVQAPVAELVAHSDMITCLALESPRERALVSGCRNGDIKVWDARTLLQLDYLPCAHAATRHFWSGDGIGGLVGSYGTQAVALTDRSLVSCGGDGVVKIWGPGWSTRDLSVL